MLWPRTYIVEEQEEDALKGITDGLVGDESLEVLRQREAPQFYQLPEIRTLHKLGIPPLVRSERELRLGVGELSTYVDFLAQMTETHRVEQLNQRICGNPINYVP